jgi:membrane-bound lytic murein transglycosylase D
MAIRARLLAAAPGFCLVLVLGGFSPGATEPLSPQSLPAEPQSPAPFEGVLPETASFVPESASLVPESTSLSLVPESASIVSTEPEPPPLEYLDGGEQGAVEAEEPPDVAIDEDLPDAWAEAFAAGSRLPYHPTVEDSPYPVVINPHVQRFLDLFTGTRRDVMTLWVSRSGRYLAMIRDVLRSRGLPEELAYTAMIESGFKPDAVSRVGAKGMWQFMAPTARRYGLRVDGWVDERYDPEKSTDAAARYLSDLYKQFGSWALAQAAYNAGEMKVARAISKTGSSDFWTLAESKHLRRETKDFVPQIHAVTVIGRDPDRYGFEFEDHEPTVVDTVRVPPRTDLRRLASRIGVPFTTLRTLNRVLVRGVTPPGRPWQLRVPAGAGDTVMTALAPRRPVRVARAASAGTKAEALAAAGIHVVRPRDTVSSIAKRYGVSVRDVLRWNRLERQARIRPGDRLRVATRPAVETGGQGGFR